MTPSDNDTLSNAGLRWSLPTTNEGMERAGERFRVATAALRDLGDWLERNGENAPECILERAKVLNMTPEAYYQHYKALRGRDWLDDTEQQAITDWAIHQVQPEWKRNPNPDYPKGWK